MKTASYGLPKIHLLAVSVALFLSASGVARATNHIITFGGSLGDAYSPSSLSVNVGDTVTWEGDFSAHPLSSTSVPNGAASFSNSTGTTFSYVVTAAGTYHYQCDFHHSLGMVGTFTAASVTSVASDRNFNEPGKFDLAQNYPNPFNPSTVVAFGVPVQSFVTVKVYNILGEEVATLVQQVVEAGTHTAVWNAGTMPSGVYFCQLRAGAFTQTRRMVLVR